MNNFNELIPWRLNEWIFFLINFQLIQLGFGAFWFGNNLSREILKGKLNVYLTKPINVFLQYIMSAFSTFAFFFGIIYLIMLLIFISFIQINYLKLGITIFFSISAGFFSAIFYNYIDSIAFFLKDMNIIKQSTLTIQRAIEKYPAIMFKNSFQIFFAFLPFVYFTSYATHYLFGYMHFIQLSILFLQLITLILIFSLGLIYNWKYGLERYEAFG